MHAITDLRAELSLDGIFIFPYDISTDLVQRPFSGSGWSTILHLALRDAFLSFAGKMCISIHWRELQGSNKTLVRSLRDDFLNLLGVLDLYGSLRHPSQGLSGSCHSQVGLLFYTSSA
jgi:hypothetical protein